MGKIMLNKKHEEMLKRQMIKLLERAANNFEQSDQLEFKADMACDENKAAFYRKEADKLRKEAYDIMDMFPEFSMDSIQEHRKIEA